MAFMFLNRPGTEHGPCEPGTCTHRDCSQTYEMAATGCVICHEPIGYERRFYDGQIGKDVRDIGLAHEKCVLSRAAEKGGR